MAICRDRFFWHWLQPPRALPEQERDGSELYHREGRGMDQG